MVHVDELTIECEELNIRRAVAHDAQTGTFHTRQRERIGNPKEMAVTKVVALRAVTCIVGQRWDMADMPIVEWKNIVYRGPPD